MSSFIRLGVNWYNVEEVAAFIRRHDTLYHLQLRNGQTVDVDGAENVLKMQRWLEGHEVKEQWDAAEVSWPALFVRDYET